MSTRVLRESGIVLIRRVKVVLVLAETLGGVSRVMLPCVELWAVRKWKWCCAMALFMASRIALSVTTSTGRLSWCWCRIFWMGVGPRWQLWALLAGCYWGGGAAMLEGLSQYK